MSESATSPDSSGIASTNDGDDTDDGHDGYAEFDPLLDTESSPAEIFNELILHDRNICTTCFRRIRETIPAPPDTHFTQIVLKDAVTDRSSLGPEGAYCHPPDENHESDPYATRPAYGRIVCEACGHIDQPNDASFGAGLTDNEPDAALTLPALKRGLRRCIRRVEEKGYAVDDDAAFNAAEHLKTTPEHAGKDANIVAAALAVGIRRGHHTPDAACD